MAKGRKGKRRSNGSSVAKRRTALALLLCYLVSTELPVWTALAAPAVFARPGAGVSRLPLEVLAFDAPGFGEVSDAINLASGNLYLTTGDLSRNSLVQVDRDETEATFGTNWNYAPRMRLEDFARNLTAASAPDALVLYQGDGAGTVFRKTTPDFAASPSPLPSWIRRYNGAGDFAFYRRETQAGTQYTQEWIALYLRGEANNSLAHYYAPDGTRHTFYRDGEYVDYSMTLHQQHREVALRRWEPEGYNAEAKRTEYTYWDTARGLLKKIKDEYGRATTLEWNADFTLRQINYLLSDENNNGSFARRVDVGYGFKTVNGVNQTVVNAMTYTAPDGKGGPNLSRWVQFSHDVRGSLVVVSEVRRQVLGSTQHRKTNYFYGDGDRLVRVTQTGEPETTYSYTGGSGASGLFQARLFNPNGLVAGGSYVQDALAAGNQAVMLASNGDGVAFNAPADLDAATYTLKLRARGDQQNGAPRVELRLAGSTTALASATLDNTGYTEKSLGSVSLQPNQTYQIVFVDTTSNTGRNAIVDHLLLERGPSNAAVADVEPHDFTTAAGVTGETGALGGAVVTLYDNTGRARFRLPSGMATGTYELKVRGRGVLHASDNQWSKVQLYVGGVAKSVVELNSTSLVTRSFGSHSMAGNPSVEVVFINDANSGGSDRNAKVDYLTFEGQGGGSAQSVTVSQGAAPNNKRTVYAFDALNRLTSKAVRDYDPDLNGGTERTLTWRYAYHPDGSTAAVVEPAGKTTLYGYDARGNLTRESVFTAPPTDNLLTTDVTNPAPLRRRTFAYDNDNRLTKETTAAASGPGYSYNQVVTSHVYADHAANCCDLTGTFGEYRATSQVERYTKVGTDTTLYDRSIEDFDTNGRRTKLRRYANTTLTRTTDLRYFDDQAQPWTPPVPNPANGERSSGTVAVRQYGDLVRESQTGTDIRQYKYDAFGNAAEETHQSAFNGNSGVTKRQVLRSYNGFGQPVWEATIAKTTPEEYVAKRVWNYYVTGELDDAWEGRPENVTDYRYVDSAGPSLGRLIAVVRGPGGGGGVAAQDYREVTSYGYDDFGRVHETNVDNVFLTKTFYDTLNRAVMVERPDGGRTHTRYHTSGAVEQVVVYEKEGNRYFYTTHAVDGLGRATTTYYPAGGSTRASYDAFDRVVKVIDDRLHMNDTDESQTSTFVYDELGSLKSETGPELRAISGGVYTDKRRPYTEYAHDALGRETKRRVLLSGAVPASRGLAGDFAETATEAYDAFDRPTLVRDPDGYTTTLRYDNSGNVTWSERLVWKNGDGNFDTLRDPDNSFRSAITQMFYDAMGRLTNTIDPKGYGPATRYDVMGNVVTRTESRLVDSTPRSVTTHVYAYTKDFLPLWVAEPDGHFNTAASASGPGANNAVPANYQVTKHHNYGSRRYPSSTRAAHTFTTAWSSAGPETTYTYDHAGRVLNTTLPDGSVVEQRYDTRGNLKYTKDADDFVTEYVYDAYNKPTSEKKTARAGTPAATYASGADLGNGLTTEYGYDALGNLTTKTTKGGGGALDLFTEYRYNSLGKVVAESRPRTSAGGYAHKLFTYRLDGELTAETSYDYNHNGGQGDLLQKVGTVSADNYASAPVGNATSYSLSPGGRRTKEHSQGDGGWEHTATNAHNGLGLRVKRDFNGSGTIYARRRRADGEATISPQHTGLWRYDLNGKLRESWETVPGVDGVQNRFTYKYSPTGKEVEQTRDVQVRVRSERNAGQLAGGAMLAATVGHVKSAYNERDLLLQTEVLDKTPTGANGVGQDAWTTTDFTYFHDGARYLSTVQQTGQSRMQYYDTRGRETQTNDTNGSGDGQPRVTKTEYGSGGKRTQRVLNANNEAECFFQSEETPTLGGLSHRVREWDSRVGPCGGARLARDVTSTYDARGLPKNTTAERVKVPVCGGEGHR